MTNISQYCVPPEAKIRDVISFIDKYGSGVAIVVDDARRLLGTVTDGDIRRAILGGLDLGLPVQSLLDRKQETGCGAPITVKVGTSDAEVLRLMNQHVLRHIPIVNDDGQVVDLRLLGDLVKEYELPLQAVVMVGGFGTRIRPLTDDLPKPMLPIGGQPLLELILKQLRSAGIRRVNLTTHYKERVISDHFGDGSSLDLQISYVREDEPLGTAGALSRVQADQDPLLIINGDIITTINFRSMLQYHREHGADMTIAVREYEYQVPYGVVVTDGLLVNNIIEKPVRREFVSAGIYLVHPDVCRWVPSDKPCDMPELILRCLRQEGRVVSFPVREYWIDIGHMENYRKAQADAARGVF